MSATNAAEPGSASALIDTAFGADSVRLIDRRIATLHERIRATSPPFAGVLSGYWEEIDQLLDLRLWLVGPVPT